jgi:hypothetical protein
MSKEMLSTVEVEKPSAGPLEVLYRVFSIELLFKTIWAGPIGPDNGTPGW